MTSILKPFLRLFSWLAFNRDMTVSYDKDNNHIILTGQNDWTWIMTKRVLFVGVCFLLGYLIFEDKRDEFVFRLMGVLLMIPPSLWFFISLFYLKRPTLQKTKIIFTPDELIYNHSKDEPIQKRITETEVKDFSIYYKLDYFHTNIKLWLNGSGKPIFDFNIDAISKEESIFRLFGTIAKNWGINFFDIQPSRTAIGKIEFLRNGVNDLNLKRPFKEQKELALKSQLKLKSGKLKIGSYVLKKQGENVFIDLVKSPNEWSFSIGLLLFGGALAVFFLYLYFKEKIGNVTVSAIFLLGPAVLLTIWGLMEVYSEYYLQYLIDRENKKLKIRNFLLKWEEISFEDITQVNFKGIITKGKYNTGYSGGIEIQIEPDDNYRLMTINTNYNGLDSDLIKDSIYTDGIRLTRILADNLGKKYKWFEFSEGN